MFNNEYKEFSHHVEMYLNKKDGTVVTCILDREGLETLKKNNIRWKSHFDPKMNQYYVIGYVRGSGRKGKHIKLHRLLMNPSEKDVVDHINRDTLDNRLLNLRVATQKINQQNRKDDKRNSTGYRNVRKRKDSNKYQAYISIDKKFKSLGSYDTPEKASIVAEKARRLYYEGDVVR